MINEINNKDFVKILAKAIRGDQQSIYQIIEIYEPLINKNARINGVFNQECKDYIVDKIIKNIKIFKKL